MTAALLRTLALFLLAVAPLVHGGPSCLDEAGNAVDSWTALKQANSFNVFVQSGNTFGKSRFMLNQTSNGCVMRTARQLYNIPASSAYAIAMYSDEPPFMPVSSAYAHAKGMIITDAISGFWFIHSMPLWPANITANKHPGPFPSDTYAQSITCITISAATANTIASNLMVARPAVYSSRFDASLATALTQFKLFASGSYTKTTTPRVSDITSLAGIVYTQFAKSGSWGKDIFDDLVAPTYQTPMSCETWRNGAGGRMSSICGVNGPKIYSYAIYQIATIKMPNGVTWGGTSDHSKWAISATSTGTGTPASLVSCIADLNRMCSQESRGGGALCLVNATRWTAMNSVISKLESCWQVNPCSNPATASCYWCKYPSAAPTALRPTPGPSTIPTPDPTPDPTPVPTVATDLPSTAPTASETLTPSTLPTANPTPVPSTFEPSPLPSSPPSHTPTSRPTSLPTPLPTLEPTWTPSSEPPTLEPSLEPTRPPPNPVTPDRAGNSSTLDEPTASPTADSQEQQQQQQHTKSLSQAATDHVSALMLNLIVPVVAVLIGAALLSALFCYRRKVYQSWQRGLWRSRRFAGGGGGGVDHDDVILPPALRARAVELATGAGVSARPPTRRLQAKDLDYIPDDSGSGGMLNPLHPAVRAPAPAAAAATDGADSASPRKKHKEHRREKSKDRKKHKKDVASL